MDPVDEKPAAQATPMLLVLLSMGVSTVFFLLPLLGQFGLTSTSAALLAAAVTLRELGLLVPDTYEAVLLLAGVTAGVTSIVMLRPPKYARGADGRVLPWRHLGHAWATAIGVGAAGVLLGSAGDGEVEALELISGALVMACIPTVAFAALWSVIQALPLSLRTTYRFARRSMAAAGAVAALGVGGLVAFDHQTADAAYDGPDITALSWVDGSRVLLVWVADQAAGAEQAPLAETPSAAEIAADEAESAGITSFARPRAGPRRAVDSQDATVSAGTHASSRCFEELFERLAPGKTVTPFKDAQSQVSKTFLLNEEDAGEVAHAAMVRVCLRAAKRAYDNVVLYFYKAANNGARNHLRDQKKVPGSCLTDDIEEIACPVEGPDLDDELDRLSHLARLQAAVCRLSENDRNIVALQREGLSLEQMAQRLGVTKSTAKRRLDNVMLQIEKIMKTGC